MDDVFAPSLFLLDFFFSLFLLGQFAKNRTSFRPSSVPLALALPAVPWPQYDGAQISLASTESPGEDSFPPQHKTHPVSQFHSLGVWFFSFGDMIWNSAIGPHV
ncbi:hypothetical protein BO82DRAFT_21154 [Aspergillus uvarum CBS 121591]|uniref:Uncharacterized protein n=1 Tax=Aspergillus uvarum CBS 121591 TaxID=1448315 RepID=A0A319BT55_9EURO|nr:hypothetical protein BO82DRAFT_21154 [Aspergillus uvarum CBS 121591]PYH75527.1 hypothetical protein BO82DRAFT_21154 [Aspergillus uvarum CBS 121591]